MKKVLISIVLMLMAQLSVCGQNALRRPVDTNHPAWFVHIDTWNWPDPQKIIDLIPEDIRPYCVMNISLSISHDDETGVFNIVRDGYSTAESWVRTCAQNRMWCMVQPASGGFSHFPDNDMTVYEEFYEKYPNFIGWNYCEQFWGFDDKFSVTVPERLEHFAKLINLANKYGGYLTVSWCGGIWHFDSDPLAMMKRSANLLAASKEHPENFMMCYKYTTAACWYNNESLCLGTFVSGLADNYGVRFDQCGWALADGEKYPTAAGLGVVLDQTAMNGATVFDGPELIWQQDFKETGKITTSDGYTARKWERFPQFDNIWIDYYRKILDGTLRIPTRKEVINRTVMSFVADVNSGNSQAKYALPNGLYDGLYKQDGEGDLQQNTLWFKKTGRYPAIPAVPGYYDTEAKNIPVRVSASKYASRWASTQAKVAEMNKYCPEEYTGNLFATRHENLWVTYYPFRYGTTAWARIPLKYNTCDSIRLDYSEYSSGIIREYADSMSIYLNNYRVDSTELKTDIIRIYGSTARPSVTTTDRSSHAASKVGSEWKDGVMTITVTHNGPVEMAIKCAGQATGRLTAITPSVIERPAMPEAYTGPRQYEAECFDYKNIAALVTNGVGRGIEGYTAQGYMNFGTKTNAVVRDTITVDKAGKYTLAFRYSAPNADVRHVMLYLDRLVGSGLKGILTFPKTNGSEDWQTATMTVDLNEGANVVYLRASTVNPAQQLYLDNLVVTSFSDGSSIGSIDGSDSNSRVTEESFYTIGGTRVDTPAHGLYIIRQRMSDGKTRMTKAVR